MKKKRIIAAIILMVIIALTAITYSLFFTHPANGKAYVYIDRDDNFDSVCVKLKTEGQLSGFLGFKTLNAVLGYEKHIRPGAYLVDKDINMLTLFRRMRNGRQTPVELTIPSVRTVGRLAKTLSRQLMADSTTLMHLLNDSSFCHSVGYDTATIAALFIPNTYEVYWTIEPKDFVEKMRKEHDRFWNPERLQKAQNLGLTPTQVSTLASIVEEETANNQEKPMVAGLYLNRLRIGMPLQADPTVKFGLQDFSLRRILKKHIQTDTPYNTYLHEGLPPGPIRIPSIVGIDAVLNHVQHDYIYMCAKEDFSGTHNFATTFQEHQANARRYQKALNERNIK